jgi:hypothetical protein
MLTRVIERLRPENPSLDLEPPVSQAPAESLGDMALLLGEGNIAEHVRRVAVVNRQQTLPGNVINRPSHPLRLGEIYQAPLQATCGAGNGNTHLHPEIDAGLDHVLVLFHAVEHTEGVTEENRGLPKSGPIDCPVSRLRAVAHRLLSQFATGSVKGEPLDRRVVGTDTGLLEGGDHRSVKRPTLGDRERAIRNVAH